MPSVTKKGREYANKAWDYYLDHNYEDALDYINSALDLDRNDSYIWRKKGIMLGGLKRYSESEECFNRSLKLVKYDIERSIVRDYNARMLYDWSDYLFTEAINSSTPFSTAIDKIKEAKVKIAKAIDTIPEATDENIEKYRKKKKEIESWEYSIEAWNCHNGFEDEDALDYIDLALDLDDSISSNWNRKGIILEGLERFEESEKCYNKSLELSKSRIVQDNKARMLYDWSNQLIKEAKKLSSSEALDKLKEAKNIITRAITAIHDDSEEDIEIYLNKRDEIDLIETLKGYDKSELFTVAGTDFYKNNLKPGWPLKLVKEQYNKHDRDAIAVYAYGEKIGYVANNDDTRYELTSSASELQDKIDDITQGSYLFSLEGIAGNRTFHIGRIIC